MAEEGDGDGQGDGSSDAVTFADANPVAQAEDELWASFIEELSAGLDDGEEEPGVDQLRKDRNAQQLCSQIGIFTGP